MAVVSDSIQSLKPYEPGKPISELERELGISDIVKLASNENPLGPSPKAVEAIQRAASDVHLYPDAAAYELREAIAAHHNVPADHVLVGNGSNEIVNLVARTFLTPGRDLGAMFDYSFIAYRLILQAFGVETEMIEVGADWTQELDLMAAKYRHATKLDWRQDLNQAAKPEPKMLFVANPNNPTGAYTTREELLTFLHDVPQRVFVVIDEAYVEYVTDEDYCSALEFRDIHPRLIVCRTFSKCYGLAGLRVGYAIAEPQYVEYLNRVREPFNCNSLGQVAAIASLNDSEFVEKSVAVNSAGREQLSAALPDLGLTPAPSQANFFLCKVDAELGTGVELYEKLLQQGVIIRPVAGYGIPDHVRISIGTEEDNNRLIAALETLR